MNKINFTSLGILDLSYYNHIGSSIPGWVANLNHLVFLDLSECLFEGPLPSGLKNMTSLRTINFRGVYPTSLEKLCKLKTIDLSYNEFSGEVADIFKGFSRCKSNELKTFHSCGNHLLGRLLYEFNGTLPESLGRLVKLEGLFISNNSLEGVVSDVHFANLTRLCNLDAGGNSLTLNASKNWVPSFQVERLILDSWKLGPQFPLWLPSQMKLAALSIANTRISDSIPTLFWPILLKLNYANLSRNEIHGEISRLPNVEDEHATIDKFQPLQRFATTYPPNLNWLDLSNNSFSRSIYHMLCDKGKEPNIGLSYLNMGNNCLSGKIPDCWKQWQSHVIIKLENNNLEGSIPSSIGLLPNLKSLHLRHNKLTGELPQTLRYCSSLLIIALGEN
ncbi:receptor-like protein EIX1 [Rhododendron vialii]|uniref:receptor-like protein EIX1 n=1 Tax=Rhododendron vialii TaxID=182163 RepID=UPI00265FA154|nr:receptor-like protein EIX1 [Rhododendron vialii]